MNDYKLMLLDGDRQVAILDALDEFMRDQNTHADVTNWIGEQMAIDAKRVRPMFEIIDSNLRSRCTCDDMRDAAYLVSMFGAGSSVRLRHTMTLLWVEGSDGEAEAQFESFRKLVLVRMGALMRFTNGEVV